MSLHTILGAGGVVANDLAEALIRKGEPVRLVSRQPKARPGASLMSADISIPEETDRAVQGSSIVYLCAGLKYDFKIWRLLWPKIMNNCIDACKKHGARLLFFDNVYMYGRVDGMMTEETPYNPCSRKGDLRARIATQLMSEVRRDNLTAMIARSADFYGPGSEKTGMANILVFENLAKKKKAQWISNIHVPHSFTYTKDIAASLLLLTGREDAWNQTWHLPTAPQPPTMESFVQQAAEKMHAGSGISILSPFMIRIGGIFNTTIRELHEMTYQYKYPYLFDSSKFNHAFSFSPTSYSAGIQATALAYHHL